LLGIGGGNCLASVLQLHKHRVLMVTMGRAHQPQPFALPSRASSLDLVGCELALDFVNTSSGRGSPSHQEHIRDFDTVMQWVEHARIMTPADCTFARNAIALHPKRGRAVFHQVLKIRELIWTIGTALADQRSVSEKLRTSLTAAHAESLRFAEMKMRDGAYIWAWDPRRNVQAAILGPITLSALTLLMEKELSRTKRCAGMECGWLFFDTTKNSRRRWCEMRVCGNRAKVRAARARQKLTRKV
jgi:predicted RNA-binding Zn ribbon-like protein